MEIIVLFLFIVVILLTFAVIVTIIADSKGYSPFGWFFYGFFLGPIALAHAIVIHRTLEEEQKRHLLAGRDQCPLCDEYISPRAVVCPHCQSNIELPVETRSGAS